MFDFFSFLFSSLPSIYHAMCIVQLLHVLHFFFFFFHHSSKQRGEHKCPVSAGTVLIQQKQKKKKKRQQKRTLYDILVRAISATKTSFPEDHDCMMANCTSKYRHSSTDELS